MTVGYAQVAAVALVPPFLVSWTSSVVWVQYSAQLQIALCQELGFAGDGSFVARIWHACDGLRR